MLISVRYFSPSLRSLPRPTPQKRLATTRMAALAAITATGNLCYLEDFRQLAKLGMKFNRNTDVEKVIENIWEMCKSAPTAKDTPFSNVFIHTHVAKEFDSVNLSEWVQALDEEMSVACCMAVRDLKLWMKKHGADYLTWDRVVGIFNNCDYIIKDEESSKRINDVKTFDEISVFNFQGINVARKRQILTWFKDLFNKHGEQSVVDNSVIVQEGTLDRLADIASECGAAISDPTTLFAATEQKSDKVMEIGVIRFPKKGDAKIKLFRLVIFAFFKSSRILFGQRDQAGFEVEYDSVEFRANTDAIDTTQADKAKAKLAQPDTFDF